VKQMKDELEVLGGNANGCIERTEVQAKLLDARAKNSNSVTILASSSSAGRRAVGAMIREAISIGVPVYNDGDPYRCAEIYRECCEDILELQGGLVGDARETVENTLGGLPSLASDDMRAWKLRHTLDAILADGLVGRSVASSAASSVSTSEAGAKVSSRVAQFESSGVAAGSPPISAAKELLRAESSASSSSNATEQASAVSITEGVIAEVNDDGWEEELACSICLEFLWEPVKLGCGHCFCRCCLLRTTQLSPDGGRCPNCRSKITINPDTAPADTALLARVKAVVPDADRLTRQALHEKELHQLRQVKVYTIPVFAMSPGVRPGEPISLHLFEPRYREMARRVMAPGANKLFVFMGSAPQSDSTGSLVLVQSTTNQNNGNVNIVGLAMCTVKLDQVWVDAQAHGLYYCKTSSPHIEKIIARGSAVLSEVSNTRVRLQRDGDGERQEGVDAGAGAPVRADLPVFYMGGGGCRVGQRVMLNLFETRYRALATIVMSTHRLFIFANGEPANGSIGIVVRVNSCNFQRDGSARIQGRGIEEVTLSRVRTDRSVGNLTHARCQITSLAAINSFQEADATGDDSLDDGDAGPVTGSVGRKKRCAIM